MPRPVPRHAADLMDRLEPRLREGLARLPLDLGDAQIGQCLSYLELISRWNRAYNLTAVREPEAMLTQHLLDSLAVVEPLLRQTPSAARLLDVGSGAGLPGVVLALACPALEVTCVDSVGKKAAFVQHVAGALGLKNLQSRHARVETLRADPGWDVICSRAFATLADFVAGSLRALAPGGVWMAMKGQTPLQEMALLPASVAVFHVEQLQVPLLDAQRCLIWMRKTAV